MDSDPIQPPSARPMRELTQHYGLAEEEYADHPFQLLITCIFLNKTRGERAIPAARRSLLRFPDPDHLARAKYEETALFFKDLGLFRRAAWVIDSAKSWLSQPPKAGVIHQKSHNGKVTVESEVAHLKGIGPYASDAWRIFYKDELYRQAGFDVDAPEWTTFQPKDKELCAYIKWKRAVSQKQSSSKENQEPEELLTGLKKLSLGDSV